MLCSKSSLSSCGFIWCLWLCFESEPQITVNVNKPVLSLPVLQFLMYFYALWKVTQPPRPPPTLWFLFRMSGSACANKIAKFNLTLIMLFVIFIYFYLERLTRSLRIIRKNVACVKAPVGTKCYKKIKKKKFVRRQLWTQSHSHRLI